MKTIQISWVQCWRYFVDEPLAPHSRTRIILVLETEVHQHAEELMGFFRCIEEMFEEFLWRVRITMRESSRRKKKKPSRLAGQPWTHGIAFDEPPKQTERVHGKGSRIGQSSAYADDLEGHLE